ncbi:hypothetical protein KIW84_042324 [Lathyrus oleraceus]|uniref:CCHC-type domain-containing protein n=1 Tax=Pisum sativum TaxID=3888 RepID=A0A9D4XCH7_PEA|nr:hypothetical protein KIW84_042324 [Pisum sativum]
MFFVSHDVTFHEEEPYFTQPYLQGENLKEDKLESLDLSGLESNTLNFPSIKSNTSGYSGQGSNTLNLSGLESNPPNSSNFESNMPNLSSIELITLVSDPYEAEKLGNGNNKNKGKKRAFKNNKGSFGANKKPKLECWKCGKTGHFKKDCRSDKKHDNANASGSGKGSKDQSENQGQKSIRDLNSLIKHSVSLNSEAFYVQDDAIAWWIDSDATTHVCKDRFWFKTLVPVEDGFVLYMGDNHFAPVEGKGNVVLEFSSGKTITLFNVLYVPKLRKNLISGPVLNKLGYKQVCESDKYVLSKSGVFVGFGYYNNGMFMMNLNGVHNDSGSVFMSSSNVINSSLWHARLGHGS